MRCPLMCVCGKNYSELCVYSGLEMYIHYLWMTFFEYYCILGMQLLHLMMCVHTIRRTSFTNSVLFFSSTGEFIYTPPLSNDDLLVSITNGRISIVDCNSN